MNEYCSTEQPFTSWQPLRWIETACRQEWWEIVVCPHQWFLFWFANWPAGVSMQYGVLECWTQTSILAITDTVSLVPHSAGLSWESWLYLIRISTPLVMTISDYRIVKVHYSHLNWQNVFYSVKNSFVDISCLSLQLGWNDSQILCILLKLILNVLMDQLNLGL